MKRMLTTLLATLLSLGLFATAAVANEGNPDTGQRIYLKMMGDPLGMNGADFAKQQTMQGWKDLFEGNGEKFIKMYAEKYPAIKDYLTGELFQKHMPHIKAFFIHYAKDSGNFPSCSG